MPEGTSGTFTQSPAATSFLTLYTRVQNYVQAPSDTEVSTIAKEGINEGILRVNTRNWTWARFKDDVTLVAGTQEYALVASFRAPRKVELINNSGDVLGSLEYLDAHTFNDMYPSRNQTGDPCHYTIFNEFDNGKLTLSCIPSSAFVALYTKARVRYYRRLNVLSADGDLFGGPTEVEPFLTWYARATVAAHWQPQKIAFADKRAAELWAALVETDIRRDTTDW